MLNKCKTQIPKENKVNICRGSGMSTADEFGADTILNEQMSSQDAKGHKKKYCMR